MVPDNWSINPQTYISRSTWPIRGPPVLSIPQLFATAGEYLEAPLWHDFCCATTKRLLTIEGTRNIVWICSITRRVKWNTISLTSYYYIFSFVFFLYFLLLHTSNRWGCSYRHPSSRCNGQERWPAATRESSRISSEMRLSILSFRRRLLWYTQKSLLLPRGRQLEGILILAPGYTGPKKFHLIGKKLEFPEFRFWDFHQKLLSYLRISVDSEFVLTIASAVI